MMLYENAASLYKKPLPPTFQESQAANTACEERASNTSTSLHLSQSKNMKDKYNVQDIKRDNTLPSYPPSSYMQW